MQVPSNLHLVLLISGECCDQVEQAFLCPICPLLLKEEVLLAIACPKEHHVSTNSPGAAILNHAGHRCAACARAHHDGRNLIGGHSQAALLQGDWNLLSGRQAGEETGAQALAGFLELGSKAYNSHKDMNLIGMC